MEALLEPAANQPAATVEPPAIFNFAAYLFQLNESRAGKTAYIDDTGTTTYGELGRRPAAFASALRTSAVWHPEERILLVMLDTVELPIVFLGALYAGVVPVVANTLLTAADYVYMLTHSHARAVIASDALSPNVTQAMDTAEHDGCQLIVSQPPESESLTAPRLNDLIDAATPAIKSPRQAATISRSGCIHRVRPANRKAPSTRMRICTGPPSCMRNRFLASSKAMWFSRRPNCSLRTVWVTVSTFPLSVGATAVLMAERPTADAIFTRLVQHRPTIF